MDVFTALLAYGVIALALGTFSASMRSLYYQRIGLDKRRRTPPRILAALASLYLMGLYAVFLTGSFGPTLPVALARPAVVALLGALFVFTVSD